MKKILIFLALLALLLASCQTPTVKGVVDRDARVQNYLSLFPDATYTESVFKGAGVEAIKDVILQDCGDVKAPSQLVRATYTSRAATLVIYLNGTKILCVASKLNQEALAFKKGDPASVANGTLITVNSVPITLQDVQKFVAQLPPSARNKTTLTGAVTTLLNQELLRQAAADTNVSDKEVDAVVAKSINSSGGEAAFESALKKNGLSLEKFRKRVRDQLKLQKFLDEQGVTEVNVSENATRNFYLQNTNAFLISDQVRFRQIFINFNKSGGKDAAAARLKNVLKQLNSGLDFCEAVKRYSDDLASKSRCGEYIAARGVLQPNLEASLFSLSVNQSTVVASPDGYHIFYLLDRQRPGVVPYSQARDRVAGFLKNQLVQQRLNILLLRLRADADIVDYTQG